MHRRGNHAAIQSRKRAGNRHRPAGSLSRSINQPRFILVLQPCIDHKRASTSMRQCLGRVGLANVAGSAAGAGFGCGGGLDSPPSGVTDREYGRSSKAGRSRHLSASFAEACFRVRATAVVLQGAGLPFASNADVRCNLFGERRDIHIADTIVERRNIL